MVKIHCNYIQHQGESMNCFQFQATRFVILNEGDVLTRKALATDWGRLFVVWKSLEGWQVAERDAPGWTKPFNHPFETLALARDAAIEIHMNTLSGWRNEEK